ncbi:MULTISPECIES: aminoacyl-tRNA hydrolase [unclassified Moraxella]|uniref:aminoacyl-tRNA hydrolase n=1 Tax=unclassified Moraxella TaxID=2685852 RepID=UPI003AF68D54
MSKIKLIVGLGNPGQQYAQTRHNAGFWFVERIAHEFNIAMSLDKKFHGMVGRGQVHGVDIRLLLPQTFMNKSGEAVIPMMNFYDIANDELLIAHDELDLEVARMRLKTGGGHGGHNGLRDIVPHIGADFHRLRLGIGHPGDKAKVSGYVLGKPTADEQIALDNMLDMAMRSLPDLVQGNMNKAQQAINSFKLPS